MSSILKRIIEQNKSRESADSAAILSQIADNQTSNNRRDFLRKSVLGGMTLGGLISLNIEDSIAQTTANVSRASSPSDLKITDLRYALTSVMGGTAIIRIDTNQGIYGLGEVRDSADVRYALMLKSRILGMNPL